MSQPRDDRQDDLFRPSLEKIINVRHPLVRLVAGIDWDFLAGRFSSVWGDREQRPWRELKFLRTRLGGVIRDIRRKIEGDIALEDRFGSLLDLAHRVRHQTAASAWTQVYSLHAPEVECIGKARSGRPTPFSPPPAATSACSCAGWRNSCVSCYDRLTRPPAAAPCLVRRSETFFTDDSATICPPSLTEQR